MSRLFKHTPLITISIAVSFVSATLYLDKLNLFRVYTHTEPVTDAMARKMRAMTFRRYGAPQNVLKLEETTVPTPKANEVLVKVHAAGVNAADWRFVRADPFPLRFMIGIFGPRSGNRIPGGEVAGVVESIGKGVTKFKVGDEVFGELPKRGGFAEYTCTEEKNLLIKPSGLSFEEAACIPLAGYTALQAVREDAAVTEGQSVLVTGASGGVGSFTVQIAKSVGAHVTATASASKVDAVKRMGADRVIDYTTTDYTAEGIEYDVILDAGSFTPFKQVAKAIKPGGLYVFLGGSMSNLAKTMMCGARSSEAKSKRIGIKITDVKQTTDDLAYLTKLVEDGTVRVILDKTFEFNEAAQAIQYMEERKVIGKIPVKII